MKQFLAGFNLSYYYLIGILYLITGVFSTFIAAAMFISVPFEVYYILGLSVLLFFFFFSHIFYRFFLKLYLYVLFFLSNSRYVHYFVEFIFIFLAKLYGTKYRSYPEDDYISFFDKKELISICWKDNLLFTIPDFILDYIIVSAININYYLSSGFYIYSSDATINYVIPLRYVKYMKDIFSNSSFMSFVNYFSNFNTNVLPVVDYYPSNQGLFPNSKLDLSLFFTSKEDIKFLFLFVHTLSLYGYSCEKDPSYLLLDQFMRLLMPFCYTTFSSFMFEYIQRYFSFNFVFKRVHYYYYCYFILGCVFFYVFDLNLFFSFVLFIILFDYLLSVSKFRSHALRFYICFIGSFFFGFWTIIIPLFLQMSDILILFFSTSFYLSLVRIYK